MPVDRSSLTDECLMSRFSDTGCVASFEELVGRYDRMLMQYLAKYLGNTALAEDVKQNVLIQVFRKAALYEDGRPFRNWLFAVANHKAVDAIRRVARHPTVSLDRRHTGSAEGDDCSLIEVLTGDEESPLEEMEAAEQRAQLNLAIERLPAILRESLRLAYFDDYKYREIAELQNIPEGTVKSRLHSGLEKLRLMVVANPKPGRPPDALSLDSEANMVGGVAQS